MSMFSDEDQDFGGVVAGPLGNYHQGAVGPLRALAVRRAGVVEAYLFHGVGEEKDRAGILARREGGFEPDGAGYWSDRLRALHAAGMSAVDAIGSLAGASGPEVAGIVDREYVGFASKDAAKAALEPERFDASDRGRPSRDEIDTALRGDARMTEAVRQSIRELDAALAVRPTSEPVTVTLTRTRASLPEALAAGTTVHEPTYLAASLLGDRTLPSNADIVVKLVVPQGTPAIYHPASLPGDGGTLLLARGLHWRVERVIELPSQVVVTARVVGRGDTSI
jgi:hypothetical protein